MPNIPCTHRVTDAEVAASRESVRDLSRAVADALKTAGRGAMLVAWLSDFHFFAPRDYGEEDLGSYRDYRDPRAIARLALEELKALRPAPDLLVYGGDMVNSGHRLNSEAHAEGPADEYETLRQVLDAHAPPPSQMPSLLILGNHDHGDTPLSHEYHRVHKTWARTDWPRPVEPDDFYYAADRGRWRFIALDTRHSQGLSPRQRAWFAAQLRDTSKPTVVLQHRPYLECGNIVDTYRFIDDESLALVSAAPQVRAIVSGHTHKAFARLVGRKSHIIFPGLAYGIDDKQGWGCLILSPDQPAQVIIKELAVQFDDGGTKPSGKVRSLRLDAILGP